MGNENIYIIFIIILVIFLFISVVWNILQGIENRRLRDDRHTENNLAGAINMLGSKIDQLGRKQ